MPDGASLLALARRLARPAAALVCAAAVLAQAPPSSQPGLAPRLETFGAVRKRLARTRLEDRSPKDRALLAALNLVLAVGQADGRAAVAEIDAVGYQPLPLRGELPEDPGKPIPSARIQELVAARPRADLASLTTDQIEVLTRDQVRGLFSAVADWMLPQDWAVVFRPPPRPWPNWIDTNACLVVRLRGGKPAILGGNLLEVLGLAGLPVRDATPER